MASYIIKQEITIERQEGDTSDLEILVPEVLDMATYEPTFYVIDRAKNKLITKLPADFVIDGQTITTNFAIGDTAGKVGKYRWQLEISNGTNTYTIGRGNFVIIDDITD